MTAEIESGELWHVGQYGRRVDAITAPSRDAAAYAFACGRFVLRLLESLDIQDRPPTPTHLGKGKYIARYKHHVTGELKESGPPFTVYKPRDVSARGDAEEAARRALLGQYGPGVAVREFPLFNPGLARSYLYPDGRADWAHFLDSGELIGTEIKTPRDSVARLHIQAPLYTAAFDRAYLAAPLALLEKGRAIVPPSFGLILLDSEGQSVKDVWREAAAPLAPAPAWRTLGGLWSAEIAALAKKHGVKGKSAMPRIHGLAEALTLKQVREEVAAALLARTEGKRVKAWRTP